MSDWQDEQQMRLDVFLEEFEATSEKWKRDIKTLDHFRRQLEAELGDLVDDPLRVPGHTGSKLRDFSKDMQRAEKVGKEVAASMKKIRDGLDREAEMMLLLRKRHDENFPGAR